MPRGKKKLSLEEQLEKVTTEIENMENSLKEMKNTKKELEEQINMNQLSELNQLIKEKGITIEYVKELLES